MLYFKVKNCIKIDMNYLIDLASRMTFPKFLHSLTQIRNRAVAAIKQLEAKVSKKCWPTEKMLGFEWPETAQIILSFSVFYGTFFNIFRIFLVRKTIFANLFLLTRVFLKKIQNIKKGSVENETIQILYKRLL